MRLTYRIEIESQGNVGQVDEQRWALRFLSATKLVHEQKNSNAEVRINTQTFRECEDLLRPNPVVFTLQMCFAGRDTYWRFAYMVLAPYPV